MIAMMAPAALPFFIGYARDVRRPAAVAVAAGVYGGLWAVIGLAAGLVMNAVMLPAGGLVAGLAIAFAVAYGLTPVMRCGQTRCQEMCHERPVDRSPVAAAGAGLTYGVNCVACSAGVMVAVVVLGMSNPAWMAAGAAMVLLYKVAGRWTRRIELVASIACVLAAAWLVTG